MRGQRYYICSPVGKVSGGPELAHQMCGELIKNGCSAQMYYVEKLKKEPVDVPVIERYAKYGTSHVTNIEDVESEEAVLIVPEAIASWIEGVEKCKKVLWWMSVDNFWSNLALWGGDFKQLQNKVNVHLVQSQYAYQHLLEKGIPNEKIVWVSDYIGENYGKFSMPSEFRQNIVLYNPRKGFGDLEPLIKRMNWVKWMPLINLSEEQMIMLMGVAKVYIDFGKHPGKDRIPREAVSCGCCVITNRKGSAAFYEDVPISDYYKIDDVPTEYDRAEKLIRDICDNYVQHNSQFDEYRKFVAAEKSKFSDDVKNFINIMEK